MNVQKSLNSDLLEEVFSEIESSEVLDAKDLKNASKPGFLEEIVNIEKELLSGKRKTLKCRKSLQEYCMKEGKSVIHEGLTDSSEDEDNKYFEKSRYSEYGKNLKKLLEIKAKPDLRNDFATESNRSQTKPAKETLKAVLGRMNGNTSSNNSVLRDPILGMNIINPLVSLTALKQKLIGRISISTSRLKKFLETSASKDSDWVTGGAIVRRLSKTSQKGNQYCVWSITDLSSDIKTVCVFLFGSAYKEHWKTSTGTVVGILNPTVMNNYNSEATLRVDNAQKILIMGMSKDYGLCKSKKKNGENCPSVVNKSKCDYCLYHMKKEYNKACRRSDLQPPKIGRNLDNLRAKILGKSQVFYGGKTVTGVVGRKSTSHSKKDEERMKLLSQNLPSISESQKQKDESTLKRLNQNSEQIPSKNKSTPTPSNVEHQMIDLEFTVSKKERLAAKVNALKYIREHGSLKKIDKDRIKRTPEQISSVKRKLEVEEEKKSKKIKTLDETPQNPLKEKYVKNGITEEFLKLMNSENRNNDILKMAENEEIEKYFNKLEMREKIENKMATIFKVECKAVRCLKCNYKSFSATELCKKEKHPLKVFNTIKRFWKCGKCFARTVCLELVPLHSCKICGSSKWERTSMMPERKDTHIIKEPLTLRGDEEKFLGAAANKANLNLLVPEEAS